MIFTLGNFQSYEKYFQEQGTPQKGIGGSVWLTYDEAHAARQGNFKYQIYGVLADWEKDTEPSKEGDWHDLLVNADLVRL
jgi:hypothetical protein